MSSQKETGGQVLDKAGEKGRIGVRRRGPGRLERSTNRTEQDWSETTGVS